MTEDNDGLRTGGSGHGRRTRAACLPALMMFLAACASAPASGPADPAVEARLVSTTAPRQPLQVTFDWNLTDRDARFSGRGVLRVDVGYRARVDLFGPRGETLAAAVVEGERMRIVPAGAEAMLPPPALLWSALGVFRAPADEALAGTTAAEGGFLLAYAGAGVRWTFRFEGDTLRSTEWTEGRGRRTVVLTGASSHGLPEQAVFRDWTEFRELVLRVTDVEERTGFGADVWTLPGGF
jgi:hypothetical protein